MKKFISVLFLTVLCWINFPCNIAQASDFYWAKVTSENSLFYAQPDNQSGLFVLPKTYFVKLVDEDENFYKAEYKELSGFVKKEDVLPMNGTPICPYFVETFRVFLPSGAGLYPSTKMATETQILTIPYLYENLVFYGSIEGQTAVPDKSNIWHYCRYEDEYGYVYSAFVDKLSTPPINNETFEKADVAFSKKEAKPLSESALAFIIIGVSLPTLAVLYLLVKPNLSTSQPRREKSKYKARKKRDYFEFDPSDLG